MAWRYDGTERPPFSDPPAADQESVWDYPRPPVIEPLDRSVIVRACELVVAETLNALRVLETASPPTIYVPLQDVQSQLLRPGQQGSHCEWKGLAIDYHLEAPWGWLSRVGWGYPVPAGAFGVLADYVSFYPSRLECYINGELARPQPGGFYGGWLTSNIVGPVKGAPGTSDW
jgi:uncharacterized protein (DUF427 family)